MKFYTADLHWDHKNIIRLSKRPFESLKDMQDIMWADWNATVSNSDDVYILGDFCFGVTTFIEYIERLNGNLHFIRGNHDTEPFVKIRKMKESGDKRFRRCFFHEDVHEMKDDGQRVVLCHYPLREWPGYFKKAIHLHGHCHGNIGESFMEGAYDVGVDVWDFKPVTLEEIVGKFNS